MGLGRQSPVLARSELERALLVATERGRWRTVPLPSGLLGLNGLHLRRAPSGERLLNAAAVDGDRLRRSGDGRLVARERRRDEGANQPRAERVSANDGEVGSLIEPDGGACPSPAPVPAATTWPAPRWPRRSPPSPLTDFVGREREVVAIVRLLRDARLVSLTGAGGIGKTRLALRVAGEVGPDFEDGVCWVDLVALADPDLIPSAVGEALGVREDPGRPLRESLPEFLRPRRLLLILDNCEHLLAGCASLVGDLLQAASAVRVLATSRQPLGLLGETNWSVPPLSLPEPGAGAPNGGNPTRASDVERLLRSEAGQLFVRRAQAVRRTFELTEQNAAFVAQICRGLDGIPLALELAAARMNVLSARQVLDRLDDRFRLLTGGARTALPRHRTLAALIDWSHDLLSRDEQVLLRRLAVFAGGWDLDAAEAICADRGLAPDGVVDMLSGLVDKSLVLAEEQGRPPGRAIRYRMLETIRSYAEARLRESGEERQIRDRHRDWFVALAEHARPELWRSEQAAWLDRLDGELDNLRSAIDWGATRDGDPEAGLRLASALWRFWDLRGHVAEGRERLARLLALVPERTPTRARGLHAAAYLAYLQGDLGASRALTRDSLPLGREVGDDSVVAFSHIGLGVLARADGDLGGATALAEAGLALSRATGNTVETYVSLFWLADLARSQRDIDRAVVLLEECLTLTREHGDRWTTAFVLSSLGMVALDRRDYPRATALQLESLTLRRALSDLVGVALCLDALASVASARGQVSRAARLLGSAQAIRESVGAAVLPAFRAEHDRTVAATRAALGEPGFASAWAEGRAMAPEEAIEAALAPKEDRSAPVPPGEPARGAASLLTEREREVAALIARGLSNHQIADRLVISERTAANHVHSILGKLEFHSRAQVAAWAVEIGLKPAK
jgi:predicted ATPase/DNA-binding CsgD family transcriptional regulator